MILSGNIYLLLVLSRVPSSITKQNATAPNLELLGIIVNSDESSLTNLMLNNIGADNLRSS